MALVKNASIIFVCTMAGNAANYCFQFAMGRSLSLEDFGTMNALLSLITSITLPTSAVMLVIARYASLYSITGEKGKLGSLYKVSLRKISVAAVIITAAFIMAGPLIKDYLKLDSVLPVTVLSIGIFGSFLMTVNLGMLQGLQRFYYLGGGIGLGGVLRLGLGVVFLYFGFRLNGALLATVLPTLLIFIATMAPLHGYLGSSGACKHERILRYSVPVFLSSAAFAFLSNIDIIMVKHFLDPKEAGLYSAVAVLGKTLLYLPSSFALAVFPMVSEADVVNGDSFRILDRALLCTVGLCAAGIAGFAIMPDFLIGLLFGRQFAPAGAYLKYYGTAMALLAVLSIIISFNLARARTGFIYSLVIGGAASVAAVHAFHSTILEVVVSIMAVFFAVAVINMVQVFRERAVYYRDRPPVLMKAGVADPE